MPNPAKPIAWRGFALPPTAISVPASRRLTGATPPLPPERHRMSDRAERLERIRELLEDRRHPERRVGIFSATNLTRIALRFGTMALSAGLVHALLGGTALEVPASAVAVGATDHQASRLWKRIEGGVQRTWTAIGVLVVGVGILATILKSAAPDSAAARGMSSAAGGLLESMRARVDARARAQRTPVDTTGAVGARWRVLLDSTMVRRGTFAEAQAWCAALGPEWRLPPGLGAWPELDSYPRLGTLLSVWTDGGMGVQIGDGNRPGAGSSSSGRPSEVRGVLCMKGEG